MYLLNVFTWKAPKEIQMADDYKVPYTTIKAISAHPNADRLEMATVYGFQVIVPKGKYQVGSHIVYVPIDSILPAKLEAQIFPEGSLVKLHHHRVRQIRLRKVASQGMIMDPSDLVNFVNLSKFDLEDNLAEALGVTKYEPPVRGSANTPAGTPRNKKSEHPDFHKYNGLNNIKWFPELFQPGEQVVIQEKLHGTNARASKLPFVANTLWKKIKKFLKLAPAIEKCYGSNNVQISAQSNYKGFYGEDLYGKTFNGMDVFSKLLPGETVFGEIIGPAIQAGYTYGVAEPVFVLFDVKRLQEDGSQIWLSPLEVEEFARQRGFEYVPVLYKGGFDKDLAYSLTKGASVYDPKTKVREGIVIKAVENYSVEGNKKAVKWVSEAYLDDAKNTDFHWYEANNCRN